MEFQIFRDAASIAFVRCLARIEGTALYAEGTGFSISTATEKCRSEVIERVFFRSLPQENRASVIGIAAHPEAAKAKEYAWCEALETLFLEAVRNGSAPSGRTIRLPFDKTLFISRIDGRWISLLRFRSSGKFAITQAVSRRLSSALLKTWGSYRNVRLYQPSPARLVTYLRGNRILGDLVQSLRLQAGPQLFRVPTDLASEHTEKAGSHYVTYYKKEDPNEVSLFDPSNPIASVFAPGPGLGT